MNEAFLSVGGNLGDRLKHIRQVCEEIRRRCGKITALSHVYETEPWGSSSLNLYLNLALKIETTLSAEDLMTTLLEIERGAGRDRSGARNEDRVADIDIIFFNDEIIDRASLQIPHPRAHQRKFVLLPMNEIAPQYEHPVKRQTVNALLETCGDAARVLPYAVL